jgi:transcriptional regulator with XRE-family HTH domain
VSGGGVSRLRGVIGATLRRRRLAQGRTLREVAMLANMSLTYLSEVERGRKEASSEVIEAVCAALDLVLADLLFEVAEELARLDARASLPRVGFIPQPAAEPVPRRAVEALRVHPPVRVPAPVDDPAPVARVIDLQAFAGRRSA